MPAVKVGQSAVLRGLCWPTPRTDYAWPQFDENTACTLCYTSGTTGNPKGVLYSHRSTMLHAFAACAADGLALSARDSILRDRAAVPRQCLEPAVFGGDVRRQAGAAGPAARSRKHLHAARTGGLHQGGRHSDDLAQLPRLVESNREQARSVAAEAEACASAAAPRAPRATIEKFRDLLGVFLLHAWGMTETSPLVTHRLAACQSTTARRRRSSSTCRSSRDGQVFGVELRLVDAGRHDRCRMTASRSASCKCAATG